MQLEVIHICDMFWLLISLQMYLVKVSLVSVFPWMSNNTVHLKVP